MPGRKKKGKGKKKQAAAAAGAEPVAHPDDVQAVQEAVEGLNLAAGAQQLAELADQPPPAPTPAAPAEPEAQPETEPEPVPEHEFPHEHRGIIYERYAGEADLEEVKALIERDLSEPYSIYTFRYFLQGWPDLAFVARERAGGPLVGCVVCKADTPRGTEVYRGYIAMLAVDSSQRKKGMGSHLVSLALDRMRALGCDEAALETEVTNEASLRLYEKLGFARSELMAKYYLNGVDAYRLMLWLR